MLKHNKKKNSYIVYEQLLALATKLAANKQANEAKFVVSVIKEHYKKGSLLNQEKKLFESILGINGISEKDASQILDEALREAGLIPAPELEKEKQKLIEVISKHLSTDLYKMPVKSYKLMASTQILFDEARTSSNSTTPQERVKIKKLLVEQMTKKSEIINEEKIDNFTYGVLVKKFNKKYSKLMNDDQKEILAEWSNFLVTNDENKMKSLLSSKHEKIVSIMRTHLSDKADYSPLLKEAYAELKDAKVDSINEEIVYRTMRYFDLVDDLDSGLTL